jgi:hypothetical protein
MNLSSQTIIKTCTRAGCFLTGFVNLLIKIRERPNANYNGASHQAMLSIMLMVKLLLLTARQLREFALLAQPA